MRRRSQTRAVRRSWRVWGAAVVVLLAAGGEAHAFYWYGWPGSQLRVEQTLVTPPVQVTNPSTPVPITLTEPQQTPEPATGLLGLLGLGALAARRWTRKK